MASNHDDQTSNQKFIRHVMSQLKPAPTKVLVEGIPSFMGENPDLTFDGESKDSEQAHAVQEARSQKISFQGIEPSDRDIFYEMQKTQGTSIDELRVFLTYRPMTRFQSSAQKTLITWQGKPVSTLSHMKLEDTILREHENLLSQFNKPEDKGVRDSLKSWSLDRFSERFGHFSKSVFNQDLPVDDLNSNKSSIYVDAIAPSYLVSNPQWSNKFSDQYDRFREREFLKQIESNFKNHNHLFLVLGEEHHKVESHVLEKALGKPRVVCFKDL